MLKRDATRRPSGWGVLRAVLGRHRRALATSAAAALAWQLTIVATPLVLGWTVDRGVEAGAVSAALSGGVLLVVLGAAEASFDAIRHRVENEVAVDATAALRRRVAAAALSFDDGDRRRHPDGDVVTRATSDVDAVAGAVDSFGYTFGFAVTVPIVIALIARLDLVLAVAVTVAVVVLTVSVRLTSRRYEARSADVQAALGECVSRTQQIVGGFLAIRGLGGERACLAALERHSHAVAMASKRMARVSLVFEPWLQFVAVAVAAVALWIGGERVVAGDLELGGAVAAIGLALVLVGPVRAVADWLIAMRVVHASAARLAALPQRVPVPAPPASDAGAVIEARAIAVDDGDGKRMVGTVDLLVAPGTLHLLDGPIGAGKSTLLRTIGGLREASAGSLRLGALPFVLDASPAFVAGSLADNVRLGRPSARDDEVRAALAVAEAGDVADDHDLQSPLVGTATDLSGGQRQRLAVARAVLAGGELLLLDNALSAVEPAREAAIVERLRDGTRTLVVVTTNDAVRAMADGVTVLPAPAIDVVPAARR